MAYSAVPLVAVGDLWTAANQNTYLKDNFAAAWVGTTAGDVDYYTGAANKSRLAIGTGGQVQTVNDGATAPEWAGGLKLIETQTLGVPGSFDFLTTPQYFTHLKVVYQGRCTLAAATAAIVMLFNNDGGANYDYETNIVGGVSTTESFGNTHIYAGAMVAANGTADIANQGVIWINNYSGAVFHKTCSIISQMKYQNLAPIYSYQTSGFWRSTAAITRITIYATAGGIDTGSVASLYGYG